MKIGQFFLKIFHSWRIFFFNSPQDLIIKWTGAAGYPPKKTSWIYIFLLLSSSNARGCIRRSGIKSPQWPLHSVREVRQEGSSGVCKEMHTREARWVSSDDAKTKQHTCCALFLQLLPPEFKYIFPLVLIFGVWSLQSYQSCSDCRFIVPAFFQNWAWNKKSWSYLCMFLEFVIKSVVSGSSCTVGENHPHFTGGIFEHLLGLISIG